jgi:putative multiple sugar transport system substrate-binding protein
MNRFSKVLSLTLAAGLLIGVTGLSAQKTVGIAMPTQSSARWIADGANMKKTLEARGYKVDLQYAEDDIPAQVAQVENMITKGDSVLVIAAIDGAALFNVLEKAHAANVKIIAYDRLIVNSPWVDYYATFDNFKVGVIQGGYIVKALGLDKGKKGPFNIELFAGSPDDTNAGYFFNGALSQLGPYIKSGVLVVKSGQTDFAKVATLRWDGAVAQKRMDDILTSKYTDANVDAVLSPYDGLSIGILSALKSVGYGTASKPLPIVTGQDAEIPSVKSILAGEQTSTVFKDTRTLAKRASDMVDSVLSGKPAEVNDTKTYNNGNHIIPSYLCDPISVDKTNVKSALVDIGYYTAAQIGLK